MQILRGSLRASSETIATDPLRCRPAAASHRAAVRVTALQPRHAACALSVRTRRGGAGAHGRSKFAGRAELIAKPVAGAAQRQARRVRATSGGRSPWRRSRAADRHAARRQARRGGNPPRTHRARAHRRRARRRRACRCSRKGRRESPAPGRGRGRRGRRHRPRAIRWIANVSPPVWWKASRPSAPRTAKVRPSSATSTSGTGMLCRPDDGKRAPRARRSSAAASSGAPSPEGLRWRAAAGRCRTSRCGR